MGIKVKTCSVCGEEKPSTEEYFRKAAQCKDGFGNQCKNCIYERNKDHQKLYIANHRDRYLETKKSYREKYKNKNKQYSAEYQRKWIKENKDKKKWYNQKRRTKGKELPSTLTIIQWELMKCYFNNKCAYCGRELPLAQEHFIPLSLGGAFTRDNIICSCKSCNSSKGNKPFGLWYPNYKYYNKNREIRLLAYLGYKSDGEQQLTLF